jgi:molybdopterin molybdotransferase
VVITSGGVSVGEMDFVKQAFEEIGGTMQFWKVAIRPGRPFVFGQLNEKFLFGLPGNPVSALVTFLLLVRPALLRWQGASETSLPSHPARLAEPVANAGNRRHFMRVHMSLDGTVRSAGTQGSHILSSVMGSNGLLDLAPGQTISKGDLVSVMRWEI